MTNIQHKDSPRIIILNSMDNVAVIVNDNGAVKGSEFGNELIAIENIPQAHKIALEEIPQGQKVIRYGEVIGSAAITIKKGGWVKENNLIMPESPSLKNLPICNTRLSKQKSLEGYTFEGFRNQDGTVGTRNLLGITTTVQCVKGVLEHVIEQIKKELLPKYPNVDGVIGLTHSYGCGVAINAKDANIPIRTVTNLSRNPNLGGEPLVIGLGCEKLQPEQVRPDLFSKNTPNHPSFYKLQDSRSGYAGMMEDILAMAEQRLIQLNKRQRETCPVSDLVVGMQCGGSDSFSGITANPLLGFASDLLVRAGATVLFSEVTEVRDAVSLLTERCENKNIAASLIKELDWYDKYLARGNADRSANTTPGNKAGGLSNIVEKALGSIAKSGTSAITDVLGPGEKVKRPGLVFCATPASDFICGTLQLAAGMNLHVFTTGRGTPYGLAMAPVVKISTRTELAEQWPDLIDIDAGQITTGRKSIEQLGWDLFHYYIDVASGKKRTWTEQHKIYNDMVLFNPAPIT